MMIKHLAIAASALTLMVGAAHAQTTAPAAPDPAPGADLQVNPPRDPNVATSGAATVTDTTAAPAATSPTASSDASAVVSTTSVTNGPVADTPENRAKYGQPMSRAGKRTAAKGN
jgi:hypothetical protein